MPFPLNLEGLGYGFTAKRLTKAKECTKKQLERW
jgi:hypothetical protein